MIVERQDASEITARVRAPGQAIAPTVVLYVADAEWSCDCGGKVDPCAHVAAAVIVLSQARQRGDDLGAAHRPRAKVSYRFVESERRLWLRRYLVREGGEEELVGSLSSLVARGAEVTPTHDELTLDRVLSGFRRGHLERERLADILSLLAGCDDVRFEGRPVATSGEPLMPRAVVEDEKTGVVLRIERNPLAFEVVSRGLALQGGTLRPLGQTDLTGEMLEHLPLSRRFVGGELGELVTTVLPEIEKKFPVEVHTKRLPRAGRAEPPRIRMEYSQRDHALSVLPTLVYGNPPRARIDDGKLVHLSGAVPIRDEVAEKHLVHRLRDELNLVFGRRVDLDGKDAARFLARIPRVDGGD